MPILRRISYRNQITIPPSILREAGVAEGSLLFIEAHPGQIILEPKEVADKDISREDVKKIDRLVRRQLKTRQYTEYPSPQDAQKHLKRSRK